MSDITIFTETSEEKGLLYNSYMFLNDRISSFLDIIGNAISKVKRDPLTDLSNIREEINTFKDDIDIEYSPEAINISDIKQNKKEITEFRVDIENLLNRYSKLRYSITAGGNYVHGIIMKSKLYSKDINPEHYNTINNNIRNIFRALDWTEKVLIDLFNMIDQDLNLLTLIQTTYGRRRIFEYTDGSLVSKELRNSKLETNGEIRKVTNSDILSKYFLDWFLKNNDWKNIDSDDIDYDKFSNNDKNFVYGYYIDNQIEGLIRIVKMTEDRYEVNMLYSNPKIHNRGIGTKLMDYVINLYGKYTMEVSVFTDNSNAVHLYEKFGFKTKHTIHITKDNCGENTELIGRTWYLKERLADEKSINDSSENIKTPEELLKWMDCIQYGWIDKSGKVQGTGDEDDEEDFFREYRLQSPARLKKTKVGVCWDQTEFERDWFKFKYKSNFAIIYIEIQDGVNCPTHTFLIYEDGKDIKWFEHSWGSYRGIHTYKNLKECLMDITSRHKKFNNDETSPMIIHYLKDLPRLNCTCEQFMTYAHNQPKIDLDSFTPDTKWEEVFNHRSMVESYDINNLPDILYFSSPTKLNGKTISAKPPRGLFMSPYIGVSSIFTIDRKIVIDYFNEILNKNHREILKVDFNISYDEWNLSDEQLMKPVEKVHVHHNIPEFREVRTGTSTGFIYAIDVSSIKNELILFTTEDPNREVIYKGQNKLPIKQVIEHQIQWEISYKEDPKHGKGSFKSKPITESFSNIDIFEESIDAPIEEIKEADSSIFDDEYFTKWLITQDDIDGDITGLKDIFSDKYHHIYVYLVNGNIESFACFTTYHNEYYYLNMFYSNIKTYGNGYGQKLLSFILNKYNDKVFLVEPLKTNLRGIYVYKKLGFVEVDEEDKKYYPIDYDDGRSILLVKYITSHLEEASNRNGNIRRYLYNEFTSYAKGIRKKNTFESNYEDDLFTKKFQFVPYEMQFFYRVANPILCVLKDNLCFFQLSELKHLNDDGFSDTDKTLIFAADLNQVIVFNMENRKIYSGSEINKELVLGDIISDSFDKYIQKLIGRDDII